MVAHKVKPFPWISEGSPLFAMSQTCVFILAANWVMQGVRGMDNGERVFRLTLFVLLALFFELAGASPLMALVLAHSVNFAFNGHPWVCMRYCAFYKRAPSAVERWLDVWIERLRQLSWLDEAAVIGSRAKRMSSSRSDIDLRLIIAPGFLCWLQTNILILTMRSDALIRRIPLDLYAYDKPQSLRRFDQSEPMALVLDRRHRLRLLFADRQLISL